MDSMPYPHPSWCDRQQCGQDGPAVEHRERAHPWTADDGTDITVGRASVDGDQFGLTRIRVALYDVERSGQRLDTHLSLDDAQRLAEQLHISIGHLIAELRNGGRS